MNLQSALNYRTHCIVCNKVLRLKNLNNPRLNCKDTKVSLKVTSNHVKGISMLFKYDGTYERGKRDFPSLYNTNIFMTKICPDCHTLNATNPHYIYLKGRGAGIAVPSGQGVGWSESTLKNLKTKCCQYTFVLVPNSEDMTFGVEMVSENIRYYDDEMFCHIDTVFDKNTLAYRAGFKDSLDKVLRLDVPAMDLSTISTMDQLNNKIDIYNLFS